MLRNESWSSIIASSIHNTQTISLDSRLILKDMLYILLTSLKGDLEEKKSNTESDYTSFLPKEQVDFQ